MKSDCSLKNRKKSLLNQTRSGCSLQPDTEAVRSYCDMQARALMEALGLDDESFEKLDRLSRMKFDQAKEKLDAYED